MALKTTPIAERAHRPVGILVISALAGWLIFGWLVALPFWLLAALLIFIYRDPSRRVPSAPLGIIAPLDGVVADVQLATDTLLERPALKITIQASLAGPYMVRSPTEGKVMQYWARVAGNGFAQWVQTDEQDDVLMVIRPRLFPGSLHFRVAAGERIGQGARCGSSHFASQLAVYLPANSVVNVKKGDTVLAGEDILATLVHRAN